MDRMSRLWKHVCCENGQLVEYECPTDVAPSWRRYTFVRPAGNVCAIAKLSYDELPEEVVLAYIAAKLAGEV